MKIRNIFKRSDKQDIINTLTSLHRTHYFEPGYILNDKVSLMYSEIYDKIENEADVKETKQVTFKWDQASETYIITVDKKLLRTWASENQQNFSDLSNFHMNKIDLTDNQIVAELLVELTFNSFPNNSKTIA